MTRLKLARGPRRSLVRSLLRKAAGLTFCVKTGTRPNLSFLQRTGRVPLRHLCRACPGHPVKCYDLNSGSNCRPLPPANALSVLPATKKKKKKEWTDFEPDGGPGHPGGGEMATPGGSNLRFINAPVNGRAPQISQEQWEKHKTEIVDAYSRTSSIKHVKDYMQAEHNFIAT